MGPKVWMALELPKMIGMNPLGARIRWIVAASLVATTSVGFGFTNEERESVLRFWSQPGRYEVAAPARVAQSGEWQVRLTPAGSMWLHSLNTKRGLGKVPPTTDAKLNPAQFGDSERWIEARIAWDRAVAQQLADEKNGRTPSPSPVRDPGPTPAPLVALAGAPPPLAEAVRPRLHIIRFPDGQESRLEDHVAMRPRYAFYRFHEGVMSGGQPVRSLPSSEVDRLYQKAGISGFQRRVLEAVSLLEGGFDSVNTYDTGFVSVGVIQFASRSAGAGALGRVLLRMKKDAPRAFEVDFRRFGLDVTEDARLVALDLESGEEKVGPEANQVIIQEKRLVAVFQRAGRTSDAFRIAQLQVAMADYYPGNVELEVKWNGRTWTGNVQDVIQTEAGMATLMDRLVNTGNLNGLTTTLARIATENGLDCISDCATFEYQITRAMTYRKDYLAVADLSKPRLIATQANRSGGPRTSRTQNSSQKPPAKKP